MRLTVLLVADLIARGNENNIVMEPQGERYVVRIPHIFER